MKKILYFLVALFVGFTITTPVLAQEENIPNGDNKFIFEASNNARLEKDVFGSALLLGNNVSANKKVDGIGLLGGNNVDVNSEMEYGLLVGNNVRVNGNILKDAAVVGNMVTFSKDTKIGRDTFISGNQIDLNGEYGRDIIIYGSIVNLHAANIKGNVKIHADQIIIDSETVISGELSYNETAKTTINSTSIGSTVQFKDELTKVTFLDKMWNSAILYTGLLVIFAVLALVAPKIFTKINEKNDKFDISVPFIYMGKGAVALVLTPLLMLVLFMTVIGVPLAMLLLTAYIVSVSLSTLFAAYVIGYWIWNRAFRSEKNILLIGLLGVAILYVLSLIPVVNTIVGIFVLMMGLGVILDTIKKRKEEEN